LNLLGSSRHCEFAQRDFDRLKPFGIQTVRTAICWPFIEETPGRYNFESVHKLLDAAEAADVELLFDVLHFGWPDHIDVFAATFPQQFAAFTFHFARLLRARVAGVKFVTPVNEISYLSWAGGDKAAIAPHAVNRGAELKRNLIRAAVASSEVLLNELPDVRLVATEPAIHIVGNPDIPGDVEESAAYTLAQFEAWDMLSGRLAPELGGKPEYLDVIGVNFYERNVWLNNSTWIPRTDPSYRHFHQMLQDNWTHYRRPMFVAETGTEDDRRAGWFDYVCDEVELSRTLGIPVHGICIYPIVNHPGWDDDRHCYSGLFDYADDEGNREIYQPLADAILRRQSGLLQRSKEKAHAQELRRPDLFLTPPLGVRVSATATFDEPLRSGAQGLLL
jgi:hypothetical protein